MTKSLFGMVVEIESGNTKSDAINTQNKTLKGFITPSTLTGTTVTFEVSLDGTNFYALDDVSISVAANKAYALEADKFAGWHKIKIVSGSSEAADREFKALLFDV